MEEHKYTVEFESDDSDLDVFYSLKNTKNTHLESINLNKTLDISNKSSIFAAKLLDISILLW